MEGREPPGMHYRVHVLVQGIAWVDKGNFQIIRLRTDLIAPRRDIHLDRLTTTVTFSEVRIADIATPSWLPSDVQVFAHFTQFDDFTGGYYDVTFRSAHRYSDYQSYRVSVTLIPDSAQPPPSAYVPPAEISDRS